MDPHNEGNYGVIGRALKGMVDMRKSYLIRFRVDEANGRLIKKYVGAYGTGTLTIDGTAAVFDEPIGKPFILAGSVDCLYDRKGQDIRDSLSFDMAFADIPWEFIDGHINESGGNKMVSATLEGDISADWSRLTGLRIALQGKGIARLGIKCGLVTGSGNLQEIFEK